MSALAATVRLGVFERTSDNGMGRSAASSGETASGGEVDSTPVMVPVIGSLYQ